MTISCSPALCMYIHPSLSPGVRIAGVTCEVTYGTVQIRELWGDSTPPRASDTKPLKLNTEQNVGQILPWLLGV